ncbi:hypothetical protein [Calothrix sp. PCC 6303]|nr:hypothetical protein [Calothrix sp. PCC 6303]AFZ01422.1 hypothetical protein Cal6303_2419 [Calothrix sp. PCC 6303]
MKDSRVWELMLDATSNLTTPIPWTILPLYFCTSEGDRYLSKDD